MLDSLLQRHRNTEAGKTFLARLLGEYNVPEVIHTDQLWSYRAAIREIPSLVDVNHQDVISTDHCNNVGLLQQLDDLLFRELLLFHDVSSPSSLTNQGCDGEPSSLLHAVQFSGGTPSKDAPIVQTLHAAATAVLGTSPAVIGQTFWMDSAFLAAAGIPTVVFGPRGAGAHAREEWVDLSSLQQCHRLCCLNWFDGGLRAEAT